jgi:hypothetical protein
MSSVKGHSTEDTLGSVRAHEKTDCQLYSHCLHQAAKGIRYSHAHCGGSSHVPCKGCQKYKPLAPERASPWGQPRGFDPWGGY